MNAMGNLYQLPSDLENEFRRIFESMVRCGKEISYHCPGFTALSLALEKKGNMDSVEVRTVLENIMYSCKKKVSLKPSTLLNYSEIDERCLCGAAHIRVDGTWTLSSGPVEAAKRLDLPLTKCCRCSGHPKLLGGFAEESHIGDLLIAA